jgi:hypothetical protein
MTTKSIDRQIDRQNYLRYRLPISIRVFFVFLMRFAFPGVRSVSSGIDGSAPLAGLGLVGGGILWRSRIVTLDRRPLSMSIGIFCLVQRHQRPSQLSLFPWYADRARRGTAAAFGCQSVRTRSSSVRLITDTACGVSLLPDSPPRAYTDNNTPVRRLVRSKSGSLHALVQRAYARRESSMPQAGCILSAPV